MQVGREDSEPIYDWPVPAEARTNMRDTEPPGESRQRKPNQPPQMTPIKKNTAQQSDHPLEGLGCAAMIFALLAGIALILWAAK